ncbi:Metallo-beta-lactamase superfamily protein [Methylobacterium sp. 174MFSha1.1]|uniref:MBL fold metallo-hydrolase n=1 Tax=Methylobacterium sp. 174MFSha1.1 TaxID=1502749 RepID=UPI0008E662F8|nr:MBL fold metallo-hydrolase [Methylobacterium sp. 174MFSha1.1]SFV05347.1 Metallo-beta-lactamase superfamily protein [Methylobacterium sp. 174MFSha1.1]
MTRPRRHGASTGKFRGLGGACALALCLVLVGGPSGGPRAAAPRVAEQAPGFYRMMLGRFEVTALLDGTHTFPIPTVLQRPRDGGPRALLSEVRPGEAESRLARDFLALPFEGSINAFLINTGARLVLIDAGAGDLYGSCCGRLVANLRAAGYAPEAVDEVLLTHLHADHVGGIMHDGKAVFPHATIRVSRRDADYWLDPANEAAAPPFLLPMFRGAQAALKPYSDAGRLIPFDGESEVLPGFVAVATPGHTPGHNSYRVTSGTETLLVWGDIVHVAPIQFPDPEVTVTYDTDGAGAEARRETLFSEAARTGAWIGAAHISFPGLGHIRAEDGRFSWIPANYTTVFHAQPPGATR